MTDIHVEFSIKHYVPWLLYEGLFTWKKALDKYMSKVHGTDETTDLFSVIPLKTQLEFFSNIVLEYTRTIDDSLDNDEPLSRTDEGYDKDQLVHNVGNKRIHLSDYEDDEYEIQASAHAKKTKGVLTWHKVDDDHYTYSDWTVIQMAHAPDSSRHYLMAYNPEEILWPEVNLCKVSSLLLSGTPFHLIPWTKLEYIVALLVNCFEDNACEYMPLYVLNEYGTRTVTANDIDCAQNIVEWWTKIEKQDRYDECKLKISAKIE